MNQPTITVNKPIAPTFGWLNAGGTSIPLPSDMREQSLALAPGEVRTVVISESTPAVRLTASLAENATLRLIQLRQGGSGMSVSDIRVSCAENARFEWYRVVTQGGETYDNCSVSLDGDGSSFATEIGYRLAGRDKLDVNCEAIHRGRRTKSDIHASGALSEQACKLLRGTIDLQNGCTGAVGNETEDVLLMSDTVRNLSVPVILCAEENVEGNHGATIGRLDEDLLYYMESRGIPREAVSEIMSQARLDAVIRKIPDAALRERILETTHQANAESMK